MTLVFPFYLACLPAVVALVLAGVGWWRHTRGRSGKWWWITALVVAVVLGPMLFTDRIVIDEQGIEHTTGFWFAPTRKGIRFAAADHIVVKRESSGTGRSRGTQDIWYVHRHGGGVERLDPGDLWEYHGETIRTVLAEHGITVR